MEQKQFEVKEILEKLVAHLLTKKPEDPLPYMIQFLEDMKGVGTAPITAEEREELERLRREQSKLKLKLKSKTHEDKDQTDDSEDSEDEDTVQDMNFNPQKAKHLSQNMRISVSAEVFGKYHKKESFVPTIIHKSDQIKDKIRNRLKQSFMFSALDENELEVVIDAMDEQRATAGESIIIEGEKGDQLFVVEEGVLDCFKQFFLKNYEPGDAFGELALLYNAPRAATIKAKTDCFLWVLDRNTFNYIVKDAAARKREIYEDFLKSVKLLQNMDHYERSKLADAIKEEKYEANEFIIKEGELGNVFYIISEGEAIATKTLEAGQPPKQVMSYKPGDYFGELALLRNEPRAANVIATTKVKVVLLERNSFKRLLGPLDNILKRNMDAYQNYV
eukprot:403349777